ncbi:hypothetical protein BDC45DRAFT_566013 [Circinella umbellata]|nr:hypothetical protein BDC45DRAFT_566013 [Circinella umbellata]
MLPIPTISIHLDNDHIVLKQSTINNNNHLLTGNIAIQNWNYSTIASSPCGLKHIEIRLIGEVSISDNMTTIFLDQKSCPFSSGTDNNNIPTANAANNELLHNSNNDSSIITTSPLTSSFSTTTTASTLDKNTVNFPFSIPLDKSLPASFSSADRFIRYTVYVSILTATSSTRRLGFHVKNGISTNKKNYDGKNDLIKVQATQPVFIHHNNGRSSTNYIDYIFPMTTTARKATPAILPHRLCWGTSKRSQLWRYEIQFPHTITLNDLITSSCIDNKLSSSEEEDNENHTNNTKKHYHCVLNTNLRMKNIQQQRRQHHSSIRKQQQQFETMSDMTKQSKKFTECCIAEFKFVEECSINPTTIKTVPSKNKSIYTNLCPCSIDTKSLSNTTITSNATETMTTTTTLLHSETRILSLPSYSWDNPWKVSLKLDKVPLPATVMTRKKSFNTNTTCGCNKEILQIQHYLHISLTFDDGSGYIDYNTHTFPINVIPLLSVANKEKVTATTTTTKHSSSFSSNKKNTLHRDTSFDSTTSLNTSISSNINSDDNISHSSNSSSYTDASSFVYCSSSDEGLSKKTKPT